MNYLGHAYLSFEDPAILAGNMFADHIKGTKALEKYPAGVKAGIMLHRAIDSYTDRHPATMRGKLLFRNDYRLYSGAVMDILLDHFLAHDPRFFPTEQTLKDYTERVYLIMETQADWFPEKFAGYFSHMREQNWLFNYRNMSGVQQSLKGLQRRAAYIPDIRPAFDIFVANYYYLNQCYMDIIDDLTRFAKSKTAALNS